MEAITEDAIVKVRLSERFDAIEMPLSQAIEKFVIPAGGDETATRKELDRCGHWCKKIDGIVVDLELKR